MRSDPNAGAHRRKRECKLHKDGSRAVWLAGQPALDLIVTMDEDTSTIYSAFLVEEDGTGSTFRACLGPTPAADGHMDKSRLDRQLRHQQSVNRLSGRDPRSARAATERIARECF